MNNFRRVMMCRPTHFKVAYKINPWMSDEPVDAGKALQQWLGLSKAIQDCGVEVKEITPSPDLLDMVFVCNAGIVRENKVYLSHFRHPERQGERNHYEKWFRENGFEVHGDTDTYFEGGGDATFTPNNKLWAGYGWRSERSVYDKIQKLGNFKTILCELVNKLYYHMDVCFCPLGDTLALWYPDAFSKDTQARMKAEMPELIAVSEADAAKFVCNSVVIGKTVIAPLGCNDIKPVLAQRGYKIVEVDMSEFLKAGGGCQCLVMKL